MSSSQEKAKPGTYNGCSSRKAEAKADSIAKVLSFSWSATGADLGDVGGDSSQMRPMQRRK